MPPIRMTAIITTDCTKILRGLRLDIIAAAMEPYLGFDPLLSSDLTQRRVLSFSLVGLFVFLIWQGLMLKHYALLNTRPPAWDQAVHMEIALDYRRAIEAGHWKDA